MIWLTILFTNVNHEGSLFMSTMNLTLLTDFYELTMMQGYFKNPSDQIVIFDAFYRRYVNLLDTRIWPHRKKVNKLQKNGKTLATARFFWYTLW